MTIPNENIKEKSHHFTKDIFVSKHDNKKYTLVDFDFDPDPEMVQQILL